METAGALIRRVRIEKGMSLRHLARTVGISPTYLSHIEVDHVPPPDSKKLERIGGELGIDVRELLLIAGKWGDRAAEAIVARPELRALFELAFAMDERDVHHLVEEITERQALPREVGGLF